MRETEFQQKISMLVKATNVSQGNLNVSQKLYSIHSVVIWRGVAKIVTMSG